jgi:hypothetical protein
VRAQFLAVGGAVPFVGGNIGKDTAGPEQLQGAVVEIDVEVSGARESIRVVRLGGSSAAKNK